MHTRAAHARVSCAALLSALCLAGRVDVQLPGTRVPGGCDVPAKERTSEFGCYLTATVAIDKLPDEAIFWHVYSYPTRAAAEAAQSGPACTVVESLGKVWLFTIAGRQWQPATGERMAVVGPMPVPSARSYTARYMEAVFPPDQSMRTAVHRHSGPEAWFVLTGTQCLRTPDSTTLIRAGEGGFISSGPPMVLTSVGTETRRALVLVLHDPSEAWMTMASDWTPTKECPM